VHSSLLGSLIALLFVLVLLLGLVYEWLDGSLEWVM
jgi:NADH:ubiquinone oxidoreductase subunit 3 (subunit A)